MDCDNKDVRWSHYLAFSWRARLREKEATGIHVANKLSVTLVNFHKHKIKEKNLFLIQLLGMQ